MHLSWGQCFSEKNEINCNKIFIYYLIDWLLGTKAVFDNTPQTRDVP